MRLVTLLLTSLTLLISGTASADVDIKPGEYVVFYHHDVLGSPVTATNELGQVIWHERTESYGKSEGRVSQDGTAFGDNALPAGNSRQGYTGHTLDNSAGLTYMKARYYDHHIGRFLSNDPVGFTSENPGMFNRYTYANNNPYIFWDPDGKTAHPGMIPGNDPFHKQGAEVGELFGLGSGMSGRSSGLGSKTSKYKNPDRKGANTKLSRSGAFAEAKRKLGVEKKQHPDKVYNERITDQDGDYITGRVYEFSLPNGKIGTIREHSLGHVVKGNHGSHFNSELTSATGIKLPLVNNANTHTYFRTGQ